MLVTQSHVREGRDCVTNPKEICVTELDNVKMVSGAMRGPFKIVATIRGYKGKGYTRCFKVLLTFLDAHVYILSKLSLNKVSFLKEFPKPL